MMTTMMSPMTTNMGMPGTMPGMGMPMTGSMPSMPTMMVPRCKVTMEKCTGGMKINCVCDDKVACGTLQNLCMSLMGSQCCCCCMMNGMMVYCCALTMGMCKCEMTKDGVCITCTSGDKDCCAMIQSCCDCTAHMMAAGCTCCVMMNGMPVCCC
jgi:hypothetical protein